MNFCLCVNYRSTKQRNVLEIVDLSSSRTEKSSADRDCTAYVGYAWSVTGQTQESLVFGLQTKKRRHGVTDTFLQQAATEQDGGGNRWRHVRGQEDRSSMSYQAPMCWECEVPRSFSTRPAKR